MYLLLLFLLAQTRTEVLCGSLGGGFTGPSCGVQVEHEERIENWTLWPSAYLLSAEKSTQDRGHLYRASVAVERHLGALGVRGGYAFSGYDSGDWRKSTQRPFGGLCLHRDSRFCVTYYLPDDTPNETEGYSFLWRLDEGDWTTSIETLYYSFDEESDVSITASFGRLW